MVMTTTTAKPANITDIASVDDAATARRLAEKLAPVRARVREVPTAEAVDRIRDRVFSEIAPGKKVRSIAA
jgi:hypothetical protein